MTGRASSPARYRGEGRGAITRDGCAVELYRKLPYAGEVELIAGRLPARSSVLELGCGTGRITRQLLDRGHEVTAVDNSPDMLMHVPAAARRVLCDIESLQLDDRFDVALYASCLINTPEDSIRHAQLTACRRHLRPSGRLILQRFDPGWLREAHAGAGSATGGVALAVERVHRTEDGVEISLCYTIGTEQWRQHFTARALDDHDVQDALTHAGFGPADWIDARWAAAFAL